MIEPMAEFWFNTKSKSVEEGERSDWTNLMGPYPTRAEAEDALATAARRTQQADEEERRWRDG